MDWVGRSGNGTSTLVARTIGWANLESYFPNLEAELAKLPFTVNRDDLTERAAIGVMALLIHDLEGVVLQTVSQIGSGGDYVTQWEEQVEVSGIRQAASAAEASARLAQKSTQVLSHCQAGFVSVTTFAYAGSIVHSYLHFARRPSSQRKQAKASGPKGKKK